MELKKRRNRIWNIEEAGEIMRIFEGLFSMGNQVVKIILVVQLSTKMLLIF